MLENMRRVLAALAEFDFWSPSQRRDLLARYFPRIEVSHHGIERVVVAIRKVARIGDAEIPLGDGAVGVQS